MWQAPAPGVVKSCQVSTGTAPPPPPLPPPLPVQEDRSFSVAVPTLVRYGAAGTPFVTKNVTAGNWTCSNAFFGSDPAPGVVKSCVAA